MANVIKHKRGSGSDPVANDLVVGEVAIRTDVGKLFTKMDNGSVAEIAGGGSDIAINTLSSSSGTGGGSATFNGSAYRFTLSAPPNVSAAQLLVSINGVIQKPVTGTGQPSEGFAVDGNDIILGDAPATGADFFILTFKSLGVSEPADNSVTSAKIVDGTIVNADINASAAIAGTKIDPDFGSQNITTTGTLASGDLTLTDVSPSIAFADSNNNPDFSIYANGGILNFHDDTNSTVRMRINADGHVDVLGNLDVGAGLDVTGAITGTGDLTIDTNTFHVDTTNDRVGIGTTSPSNNLEVASADHTGILIQSNRTTSTSNIGALDFRSSSTDVARIQSLVDGTIKFRNTSSLTERMRIDSSGRLLIGTTTEGESTLDDLTIATSGDTGITIRSGTSNNGAIGFSDGTSGADEYRGIIDYDHNGNYFRFYTNAAERLRIDSSGKVGIGTNSPQNPLTVAGNGDTAIDIVADLDNNGTNNWPILNFKRNSVSATPAARIYQKENDNAFVIDNNGSERMRIDSSGNVLIGTTDSALGSKLIVDTDISVIRSSSDPTLNFVLGSASSPTKQYRFLIDDSDSDKFQLRDSNTARITLDGSGNVGINDTAPVGTLHLKAHTNSWHGGLLLEDPDGNTGWNIHPDNSDDLMIGRNSDTTATSNNLTHIASFNSNGLSFTSGKGIDFSATSDASGMSEEILDDYEEGYWSPTAVDGKSLTVTAGTSNHASRRYVKIGHQVTAWFSITFSGSNSSANFITRFSGLPFSPQGNTAGSAAVCIGYFTGSETDMLVGHIEQSNSLVTFYENGNSMYSYSESAGDRIDGYITYFAA